MPWENPPFDYRRPAELALQVIDQLGQVWNGLSPDAQTEIRNLLAQGRTELVQAGGATVFGGDRQRAVTIVRFLFACEGAASVPGDIKSRLVSAHQQASRGVSTVSKEETRRIVDAIDRVTPPARADNESAETPSTEVFPNPFGRTKDLVDWFGKNWAAISIEVEEVATQALFDLGKRLDLAQDDDEREAAAQDFLRTIKAFPPVYQIDEINRTYRGELGGGSGASAIAENTRRILIALNKNPIVGPALQDASSSPRSMAPASPRSMAPASAAQPPSTQLVAKSVEPAGTTVPLHTFVDFPAEVSVFDNKIPLLVQFTIERRAGSRADDVVALDFEPEEVKQVLVVCNAEGFKEESGVTTRLIEVYAARDSQPAVFLLTPETDVEPGTKRISLDFIYCGMQVLSSSFEVEIKVRPPVRRDLPAEVKPLIEGQRLGETYRVMGALVLQQPVVETPDLVLRISMSADERELAFTLDSPSSQFAFRQTSVGRVRLPERKSPRELLESTFMSLNAMAGTSFAKRTAAATEANRKEIDKIGWNLYRDLFPQELKDAWQHIQRVRAGKDTLSLLVISDEPWIPWEMVHSYTTDEHGAFVGEGFLCEQFRMSRWVPGRRMPETMALNSALLVAPKSNLAWVKQEKAYFDDLRTTQSTIAVDPRTLEQTEDVEDALAKQAARLYHFACHGDFDAAVPDDSGLILNGPALRPSDIIGPTQVGIERGRPLIFLNACTSAGAGSSLTGLGGWAKRFVDSGATAFIGSLWEVNDTLAAQFAKAFYDQVIKSKAPLGEAFHEARQTIKAQDPGNPTWLAYVLYAHPNGKVEVGQ